MQQQYRWLVGPLLAVVLLAGCERREHKVRYEVRGTAADIAISYRNATGATEQRDVRAGWVMEFSVLTGSYVGVTAFNKTGGGTVICRLLVDGVVVQKAESVGGYKLVGCDQLAGLTAPTPTP